MRSLGLWSRVESNMANANANANRVVVMFDHVLHCAASVMDKA